MTEATAKPERRVACGPLVVALLAWLAVVLTIDAAGDYPKLLEGPGVTLDESFNVQMGVYQWKVLRDGVNFVLLMPESLEDLFGPKSNYNPDHPPLGRVWLGFWHDLVEWLFPPSDHPPNEHGIRFVTDCARVGSATAFALTVFLVGLFASRWYGRVAGLVAAVSLVLMPRLFAHAHLASLETFMNLTYSVTVLTVAHWWRPETGLLFDSSPQETRRHRTSWIVPAATGFLFGLALLTKMQAILIPPVVGLWALWHSRVRAIKPLLIFGIVGLFVFFCGWPWLWLDPAKHLHEYFARTTNRTVLNCYYFGQVWADKDVPWHYPFVMFAVTVPVGLHVLGSLGLVGQSRGPRERLLLLATLLPLVLFALPGVAVYDGERLFLVAYPMWAVLIGRGGSIAWSRLQTQDATGRWKFVASSRTRGLAGGLFLLAQSIGVITMHPCQLSYYNLLVGGLNGADRLGFERTYWGDSVTRSLLTEVAREKSALKQVVVRPVLHQFQVNDLRQQSPILRQANIELRSGNEAAARGPGTLIFFRKADVPLDDWKSAPPTSSRSVFQSVPLADGWREHRKRSSE